MYLECYLLDHLISVTWSEAASFTVGIQDVATPEENIFGFLTRTSDLFMSTLLILFLQS